MTNKIKIGDAAPHFAITDQQGELVKLADFKGKKLIIFFYPKDDTPTCTKEACNFRDNYKELKNKGFEVVGVSMDKPKKHQKFIDKYELPYTLLADEERKMITDYEAWGLKKFMGREFDGIFRKTFVIDEEQKVIAIIEKVKSAEATQQILDLVEG